MFDCDKCSDSGWVEVDELPDPQPCLWCVRGQMLWWAGVDITGTIWKAELDK